MTALQSILAEIRAAAENTSQRDKGDRFEILIKKYLQLEPVYVDQFSQVWMWQDFPLRDGKPDTGIDLVCELADGTGCVAVQCKFYDENATLQKSDIDSFLTTSAKKPFVRRITMKKLYIVRLSDEERKICTDTIKKLKGTSTKVRRAHILIKADADGP
ncbi:MAG: hypothetical protein ACRC2T_06445, partial [Thermoguttaceae bacterium]